MCSISAIYNTSGGAVDPVRLEIMNESMAHRGPDGKGIYLDSSVGLAHRRLAVIDIERGAQPMSITYRGREYVIVYNGEIYNVPELRRRLTLLGACFTTECDTEAVLWSYIFWKEFCPSALNGIFAFVVYDKAENKLFACRDRLGVKPLYFTRQKDCIYFASETKALLACGAALPKLDISGLWQLVFMAPATIQGKDVFRDIHELRAGESATVDRCGIRRSRYWELKAEPFRDSPEEAAGKTLALVEDAVKRQLVSDVPLCTFLSGGLDSSVITSIACRELARQGRELSTYSFEYDGNRENFKNSLFQPESDDGYARTLAELLGSDHTVLSAPEERVAKYLEDAVLARDFPGQADIDSSLLYYCQRVRERHTVALSGECSDEIFGGYPWFYRSEMLERDFFPWVHDPFARSSLFRAELIKEKEGFDFVSRAYKSTLESTPTLEEDSEDMITARRATLLSVTYYMSHLLCRKDRMSMASSLEVRVPFADHRIIEYVYNVPWSVKFEKGVEKALLRRAASMGGLLPDKYLYRKKSPYPKTHSPEYERAVHSMLSRQMKKDSLFTYLVNKEKISALLDGSSENLTWYGQLMSRPQLLAWLYQLSFWFEQYRVDFV